MNDIEDLQIELENAHDDIDEPKAEIKQIDDAIDIIFRFGGIGGDHHKAWVLDQVLRRLIGDKYDKLIKEYNAGGDGPNTYEWNEGIPP